MAGTAFGAKHPTIANLYPMFLDNIHSNLIVFGHIKGLPDTTTATYSHGCLLLRTDGGGGNSSIYENVGSSTTPSWRTVSVS